MKKFLITMLVSVPGFLFSQWSGSGDIYYNGGKVGIGTSSPYGLLHVKSGNSGASISNIDGLLVESSGSSNAFYTFQVASVGGGKSFSVTNAGNVGIGTSSPTEALQIGDRFTIHSAGYKIIGYNHRYNSGAKRLVNDEASSIRFTDSGDIKFSFDGYGTAGSSIGWSDAMILKNDGLIEFKENIEVESTKSIYFLRDSGNDGTRLQRKSGGNVYFYYDGAMLFQGLDNSVFAIKNSDGSETLARFGGTVAGWIDNGNNFGIGTKSPDSPLTVDGRIHAEEVLVDLNVPAPDYVFEEDYDLRTLQETEQYIKANKHLPEVPSAAEMAENGVKLKEMNMLLLKKVEELTLHLIEQNKRIEELEKMNEENED